MAIGAAVVGGSAITAYAVNKVVKNKYAQVAGKEAVNAILGNTPYLNDVLKNDPNYVSRAKNTAMRNAKNRSFRTAAKGLANYYVDIAGHKIGGNVGRDIVNRTARFDVSQVPAFYREDKKTKRKRR